MIRRIIDRLTGRSAERAAEAWVRMHMRHQRLVRAAVDVIGAVDADDRDDLEAAVAKLKSVLEGDQ